MTDDCAMFVQKKLSIVSFNCHGYNNGLSYLPVLLDSSDIVLLQEHWLSDSELDKLCFDGFVTHAISGLTTLYCNMGVLLEAAPFFIVNA